MTTQQALEILERQVKAAQPMWPEDHRKWRRQAVEAMGVIRDALTTMVDAKPRVRTAETTLAASGEQRRKKRGIRNA